MSKKMNRPKGLIIGFLLFFSIVVVFLVMKGVFFSPGKQAKAVVMEFYQYEQAGEFSKSWVLFHSSMKERFTKGNYIQDRAHVFMNHFGVETFAFTIGKSEKINTWRMSKTEPAMKDIYKIGVTQTYKGKYGNFDLIQEVFVVKEKDEWKIVWDYNQ